MSFLYWICETCLLKKRKKGRENSGDVQFFVVSIRSSICGFADAAGMSADSDNSVVSLYIDTGDETRKLWVQGVGACILM
jgi:hypothetical protein